MNLIICPGIHDVGLSDRFVEALNRQLMKSANQTIAAEQVLPTDRYAPFDGFATWSYLQKWADPQAPLLLIGFSAGVVGAIAAATLWQTQGRSIAAAIAVDGWGVPYAGNFPLHRISHDSFTHWSSALLGAGQDSFYAEPAVTHLDLWQSPAAAVGIAVKQTGRKEQTTAIAFIAELISRYGSSMAGRSDG